MLARLLLLLIALAAARPAAAQDDFAFAQRPGAALPLDQPLLDANGGATTLRAAAAGRPLVLAFGYFHCPNLCGVVREDVFAAIERSGVRAGTDASLAFVTIDPAETPADAAEARRADLARYPVINPAGAHFLTGPPETLAAIAAAAGFRSRWDASLKQFLHPAGIVVATAGGAVSGYLLGVGYAPGDLAAAVARAGRGEIGQAASPLLLLCFHFDPVTGRYTLAIVKVLRIGAALTVLTIAAVLLLSHRRRRAISRWTNEPLSPPRVSPRSATDTGPLMTVPPSSTS